ncbi:hemagglutinin repeat-containing protein [Pseudomonas putida]|uniref:hemagglutinin repeat-containing protein n=1 Tax=Pseudomonas putida TaxID=303 RepID=UPI0007B9ADA2|nr:hemagglutinin repeat-containing protein [Pseudomonas putida]
MDVRRFAFLARQPSARLQTREHFCGLPKRGLALLLANVMFWQPLWAQAADGVAVSAPGTSLGQAGNGVPIVNIAAPNGNGLSHNQFSDYNVGQQGLILNNATERTQATQLGGIILGNPNLQGAAASTILNEVNGANPSQLRGYTEVAGQSARVIVANSHGITCNGCGFINTPQVTLSTGKPVIDNGQLSRYQVDQGSVTIEGAGLNAGNVDRFEIITRSAKVNAEIQARQLAIIAGRNDVDAQTLAATARADDGSAKPQLAIDSSALGGMYAGAIKLVGTEAGVGVKLDGQLAASGGDIQLDANGQLRIGQASAAGDMRVSASGIDAQGALHAGRDLQLDSRSDLANRHSLTATRQLKLSAAGQLSNRGLIQAGVLADGSQTADGDLTIAAGALDNQGHSITASRDLSVEVVGALDNSGANLGAGRDLRLKAGTLDNRQQGKVLSSRRMTLEGGQLLNGGGGRITSQGALNAAWAQLDNQSGELSSLDVVTLNLGGLDNRGGRVLAASGLALSSSGNVDNRGGRITSQAALDLAASRLDNSQDGQVSGNGAVGVNVGRLDQQGGRLTSLTELTLDLNHGQLDNRDGLISARQLQLRQLADVDNRAGEISSQRAFELVARGFDNSAGQLYSEQALDVRLDRLFSNQDGLVSGNGLTLQALALDNQRGTVTSDAGLVVSAGAAIDNRQGEISSAGTTQVHADTLDNRGGVLTASDTLQLTLAQALDNQQGVLASGKAMSLQAASIDNRGQGEVLSDGSLQVKVAGLLDNQGQGLFSGKQVMSIDAGQLDNRGGRLSGKDLLTLRGERWDNRGGRIDALGALALTLGALDNSDQGLISGQAAVSYSGRELLNRLGVFGAVGPLQLQVEHLDNSSGRLSTSGDLDARVERLEQQAGTLMAQGNLTLRGASLDNRQGGVVAAGQDLRLFVESVDSRAGELSSTRALTLEGQRLDNSAGKVLAGTDLSLKVAQVINQTQGLLRGDGQLVLEGQVLDNQGGRLSGERGTRLQLEQALDNRQGLITSEGDLDISAATLDNRAGRLTSAGALALISQGELLNQGGSLTTEGALTLRSASLDNRSGEIGAQGAIDLSTGTLDNRDGARLLGNDRLGIRAGQVYNGSASRIASERDLQLSASGLDQQGGQLFSKTALTLDLNGGTLLNHGLINAPLLVLNNLAEVDNQQGEISSAQAFTVATNSLDNTQGKLISQQSLTLRIAQALANVKGLIAVNGLDASATALDNREGLLSSRGELLLNIAQRIDNRQGTLVGDVAGQLTAQTLDNTQGTLSSKGQLLVQAGQLLNNGGSLIGLGQVRLQGTQLDNRQQGLIGSNGALTLAVDEVDNRGGEITSKAAMNLVGERLDNSDAGLLVAGSSLTLALQHLLNRTQGRIEAQTGLTLDGQSLDNDGGRLSSQKDMTLTLSGQMLNRLGLISAEDQMALTAQGLDNSRGSLSSAAALQVSTRGALLNNRGELLTDGDLVLTSASLDNTDQGVLASKGALNIVTGQFDNSRQGSVSSNRTLDIRAGQLSNAAGGRLGSHETLTAKVSGLDQQGGKLFSDSAVHLDLGQGHLDNRGGLINAPQLLLENLNTVDNRGGEISSAQALAINARQLDNGDGRLLSNQALLLRVGQRLDNLKGLIAGQTLDARAGLLDNSGGILRSLGTLKLDVDGQLSNRDKGLIEAQDALTLASTGLDNARGTLLGRAIGVDLRGADLDNGAGLITTAGPLTLANLRKLANQGGEISTAQALQLVTGELDNRAGKLISEQVLELGSAVIDNRAGLVSGWQGLTISGQSLDNREQGTLSSRAGSVQATFTGALLNSSGGAVVAQQRLDVAADSLDNSAKGILSSGAGQRLAVTGALANQEGGLIDAAGELQIDAQSLDNRDASVSARQGLGLVGTRLDNSNGSLIAQGQLTLDLLGELLNHQGKLASGGDLLLKRAGQVDNRGGQIASQGVLTALANGFDNSQQGTLAATGRLSLRSGTTLDNSGDGLIYSQQGDLDLHAQDLRNRAGTLQAEGAVKLAVNDELDNQGGKVIAQQGAVEVAAATLDNRGGTLASLEQALSVTTTGVLRNGRDDAGRGGIVQALRLNLQSASLDNQGGRIAALNGDALLRAGQLDNRAGGVSASGLLKVSGTGLLNGGSARGEMVGQRVELTLDGALDNRQGIIESTSALQISAASLDNQGGQLRALGTTGNSRFAIGGLFDNRAGVVEVGNSDLILDAGMLQNVAGKVVHAGTGTFDIDMANLTRAGGDLQTRGGLTLTADSWTNASAIQAGRLTLNINHLTQSAGGQLLAFDSLVGNGADWSNAGLIASDGSLSLNLSGTYSGEGRVSSMGTLGLSAAQMSLGANASVAGVGNTTVNVAGLLNNQGRLTSAADLLVNAGSLNNLGTLGSNQLVRVNAANLRNDHGLLFSGADMQLYSDSLSNFYGDVYSLGGLTVARDAAGSRASVLENISGSLESAGDMRLNAGVVDNKKEFIRTSKQLVSGAIGMRTTGRATGHFVLQESYQTTLAEHAPAANIRAGRDLVINGATLNNENSVISAQRDLYANFDNINNIGTSFGTEDTLRAFDPGRAGSQFLTEMYRYNAANDPGYFMSEVRNAWTRGVFGNVRVWDLNWNESTATPNITSSPQNERSMHLAWMNVWLWNSGLTFATPTPAYDQGVRVPLPDAVRNATFLESRTIVKPGQGGAINAVIQAGGRVQLNAAQNLTNSVVQQGQPVDAPTGKAFDPKLPTSANPVVITLHGQLPPDLARQQVNPLSLGDFTLPTGQNGLFRLSGQGGGSQSSSAEGWSLGGADLSVQGRQATAPGSQPGALQTVAANTWVPGSQQIERIAHQGGPLGGNASAIGVYAPGDGAVDTSVPQRHGGAEGRELTGVGTLGIDTRLTVPGVTRIPSSQFVGKPQKYLIETNPALTDLKQFMSSDYLLGNLGYDPDQSWKRLGDGLYEQRLIQQAVVARTGQQFIDGQNNGEQLFKYLMDNAIRSKDALGLNLGVGLSAAQVAALTHDIVWMETHEVNGEQVLVPVLYLAQADNRLAPTGALIAGQDVTLIAGENLVNAGTLKASQNLSATAGKDLVNSGLIQAGGRLDLLAGNNLVNSAAGIIAGRDVSLTAVNGDIINQRDQTRHTMTYGGISNQRDYLDNAARIEAGNSLSLKAGQDVKNIGSVISSAGDLSINAGRDVSLVAVEQRQGLASGSVRNSSVQQHGATLEAGRDLNIAAGRDISAVASRIEAGRDIAMAATGDLTLTSAADESHTFSRSKKVTQSTDRITQVSTEVKAGGDIALAAGQDMAIIASQVKGAGDIELGATRDLTIASDQDESASYYLKKSKGSFGRSSSTQKESYHSTNVASVIEAGGDLTVNVSKTASGGIALDGGRDVTVVGSQLKAGGDLMLGAGGDVAVLSGVEEHGEFSKKTKSGFLGLSKSGKSQLTTTATQVGSELAAGNDLVIAAGSDVRLRASEANAGKDVELRAGLLDKDGDIDLLAANDTAYSHSEQYRKKTGLSASGGFVSVASAKKAGQEAQSSTSVGSQVLAEQDASLRAERDINVIGSGVSAGRNVSLNAGRDVNVAAAQNSHSEQQWSTSKRTGIGVSGNDNGVSLFVGAEQAKARDRLEQQLAAASQIKAGQDLDITAKRDINQTGSDLAANHDISLDAGRDINIDAARERQLIEHQRELARNGLGVSVNHNFGSTKDAVDNAGKGENAVSQVSGVLRAVDSVSQFFAGPTADVKLGNSKQSSSEQRVEQGNRASSLDAGNDLKLNAGNDVSIKGGQLQAGRDIAISGRDIDIDVAKGSVSQESQQRESWSGIHGGTSGGFKVGVGGSYGVADQDSVQGGSTASQLSAGRDVKLDARNDVNIVGSQVNAGRDIAIAAGNDVNIRSAQNDSESQNTRHNGGGEVGLGFGGGKVGLYASVNIGKGDLQREGQQQQQAYLYAGDQLKFTSGKDTTIAGAQLRGDEVIGRVGGDLKVASVTDTGKVQGKEYDLSATVSGGVGVSVSGSVGAGKTTGKTDWVQEQTRVTAGNKVDIRTERHTQLDGAVIAADNGNLKLDTGTLGFSDIAGKDKEHGYYLNAGGTWSSGGGGAQQDASQVGKGDQGSNGWSVSGWKYDKDREQIVRATVGQGDIVVRGDAGSEKDSTAGLNRDLDKAYEITRDRESRTDLYVTQSSLRDVANPAQTLAKWKVDLQTYGASTTFTAQRVLEMVVSLQSVASGESPASVARGMEQNEQYRLEVLEFAKNFVRVGSADAELRERGIDAMLSALNVRHDTEETALVRQKLNELSAQSPEAAQQMVNALLTLGRADPLQRNLIAVPIAAETVVALGAATAVYLATPNSDEALQKAAESLEASLKAIGKDSAEQFEQSMDLFLLLNGRWRGGFPIKAFESKPRYENPAVQEDGTHPASGGYTGVGPGENVTHTGGNQLDGQPGREIYVTPGHQLNPGVVYSEGAGDGGAGAKATGPVGKPLVSKGSEVTPEIIQKALQGDPAISAQGAVSLPAVQRYVDRILKGDVAPAIKMDGNVIVDGNHRYIAAKILGRNPDVTPGALSPNKVGQTKPVSELKVDQVDWGNR